MRFDHAMAAVIVVICFVWGLGRLHTIYPPKSAKPIKYHADQSVIETAQATLLLRAAAEQKLGRPISEDSLYSRFTFTM
ncbi:MAG TPA: hypothetical protein PK843_15920 [bacterium]|nr:hypothetical protein [bacterium]